ncbi:MAG: glycoside hydrolase family 3 C-terminal domain-containing protein [Paludibacteraceae bacterium]|nr:glycoside hydrolase family 3 C-terminal domain-containing protein [Paludibacteraceae bacterium]
MHHHRSPISNLQIFESSNSLAMARSTFSVMALSILLMALTACSRKTEEDRFIDSLLSRMTLEEKIGQMNQLDPSWSAEEKEALIREGKVGSVFNIVGAKEVNRLQRMAVEETRLGIPLVAARDVIHGYKTIYPIPLGQGATWNPDLIEQAARLTAQEAYQDGIRWAFSPMVDVAHDPRWGRVAEGYGEDPYLTSVMAAATVRGYQNDQMVNGKMQKCLAACVKHFAGYSASEGGRDYNTTWIPETQLRDIYLPPFKAAVDAGAMSLMCSFNDLNGLPSSANKHLNIDILRNEWHSDALLVSDWGSGSDLVPHGLCADKREAALRCINARMEMDMQGNIYTDYLAQLVEEGKVKESQIDECVRSILRLKYRLGLFENPYVPEDEPVLSDTETAIRVAEESVILLKNNGILPLSVRGMLNDQMVNILITGPLADQKKEQLGTWVFDGDTSLSITPLEAFEQFSILNSQFSSLNSQFSITYVPGLTYSRDKSTAGIAKAVEAAKKADVILFFCGEEAILSGEARCRANLDLPGAQAEMMDALAATGKPVVLIVMAGRPLTIGKQVDQAAAVLYAFHGGTMAGPALFNILTGVTVPSGKTPVTFPKMVGQIPLYYNRHNTGRPSYEPPMLIDSIPIGCPQFSIGQSSYWLETPVEPLFPFGFGLSYTTFEYGPTQIDTLSSPRTSYIVKSYITNTGSYDAYEVAQLYSRQLSGDLVRPLCELRAFRKIFIPAGETKEVSFTLSEEQLGYWHEEKNGLESRVWFATDSASFRFAILPYSKPL